MDSAQRPRGRRIVPVSKPGAGGSAGAGSAAAEIPVTGCHDQKNRERRPARPSAAAAGRNGMIRSDIKIGALVDIALKKDWPGLWPAGV